MRLPERARPASMGLVPRVPRPRRRLGTGWTVFLGVGAALVVLVLLDQLVLSPRGDRADHVPKLPRPLRYEEVAPEQAIVVVLEPIPPKPGQLPVARLTLGRTEWLLAHPAPDTQLIEAHGIWNRLQPEYESVSRSFAEAVKAIRAEDPAKSIGVIHALGGAMSSAPEVVSFVQDAFWDAGVTQTVVAPEDAEGPSDR